jgi:cytoskeletal protein RodZ
LLPLTWVVVTAAAIGFTWLAVSSAIGTTSDDLRPTIAADATASVPVATGATEAVAPATGDTTSADTSSVRPSEPAKVPPAASSPYAAKPTATFAVAGGVVTVSCTGGSISLLSATPQAGYSVEVKNGGPEEVEVKFRSDEDSELRARCVGGQPVQHGGDG